MSELRSLRAQFPEELVVIGVHSAKFPSEKLTANIRAAVLREGIEHPVVNDAGFQVWSQYAVHAWPTVVLIDPRGYYVGSEAGEIRAAEFAPLIQELISEFDREGGIDRRPLDVRPEELGEPPRPLRYPGKLLATPDGRLFVSDTGHHRLLELQLAAGGRSANVVRVYGAGEPGLEDGLAAGARFREPRGLALYGPGDGAPGGQTLYVADTGNHVIRAIDLTDGVVRTVAGTGEMARGYGSGGAPLETPLRSPWDLALLGDRLLIAMAGSHQIWILAGLGRPAGEQQLSVFAGNGREALVDGRPHSASFNQPSGLAVGRRPGANPPQQSSATGRTVVYVADSEASAVREITLDDRGAAGVTTLVGEGLFDFGDVDGVAGQVRLQHPVGITAADGAVYLADSYNHKVKTLDPGARRVATLVGTGMAGNEDGDFTRAELYEPEGLSIVPGSRLLYVADTNNHRIAIADLEAGRLSTLELRLPDVTLSVASFALVDPSEQALLAAQDQAGAVPATQLVPPGAARDEPLLLDSQRVAPGQVAVILNLVLPPGYKLNREAPNSLRVLPDGTESAAETEELPLIYFDGTQLPEVKVDIMEDRDLTLDLAVYYCQAENESVCMIHNGQVVVPLRVAEGGVSQVHVPYPVGAP